jgi:hypothetical protein
MNPDPQRRRVILVPLSKQISVSTNVREMSHLAPARR